MDWKRTATAVALAAALAAAPLSAARAQAQYPYYANNPLFWPFLAAGAILGTAALIVTSPIRVVCADCLPPPEAYYPFYAGSAAPAYYSQQPVTYYAPAPAPPGMTYTYPAR